MGTLFSSILAAFLGVKSLYIMSRHKMQAMQVVRGQIESLKSTPFGNIAPSVTQVTYDVGADGLFNTLDDFVGTMTVTIQDWLDFDNDGNTVETQINVDG